MDGKQTAVRTESPPLSPIHIFCPTLAPERGPSRVELARSDKYLSCVHALYTPTVILRHLDRLRHLRISNLLIPLNSQRYPELRE